MIIIKRKMIKQYNIADYGATLLSVSFDSTDIDTRENWIDGALKPASASQDVTYSYCKIVLLVEGNTVQAFERNVSNIVSFIKDSTVTFNERDYDFYFDGYLDGYSIKNINAKAAEVTYSLKGRKMLARQVITFNPNPSTVLYDSTFTPKGNCKVPIRVDALLGTSGSSVWNPAVEHNCYFTIKEYDANNTLLSSYQITIDMPANYLDTGTDEMGFHLVIDGEEGMIYYVRDTVRTSGSGATKRYTTDSFDSNDYDLNGFGTHYNAIEIYNNKTLPSLKINPEATKIEASVTKRTYGLELLNVKVTYKGRYI